MSKIYVIADGGGTSTDWCVIAEGQRRFFTTESYHPINWSTQFKERVDNFWKEQLDVSSAKLSFFGAGLFLPERQEEASKLFMDIGFNEVMVSSDLHAAGLASVGRSSGWIAIAGTGSVLFEWSGSEVMQVIGGKGFEIGDAGSAYYFGKLLVDAHKNRKLSVFQEHVFEREFSVADLALYGQKSYYASLARKLSSHHLIFINYHEQNIRAFFQIHLES